MPPRTLASLAHSLSAATDLDASFLALAEALAELDPDARAALLRLDGRTGLLRSCAQIDRGRVSHEPLETSIDQLPKRVTPSVAAGGVFAELGDESPEFTRMLGLPMITGGAHLALRGLRIDGQLAALIALLEPKRRYGTRAVEPFGPMVSLFELAFLRFAEREARSEAVQTLEDVTQRVHGEYVARLAVLEHELLALRSAPRDEASLVAAAALAREREDLRVAEEGRRSARRLAALEHQLTAAVGQLESAHVELHRRSDSLRQRTRTTYLIERVLALAAGSEPPRRLAEGLLALLADDMQSLRCSLFLVVPDDPETLYLAASRGLAPHIIEGARITVGQGIAGQVAKSREPLLAVDASDVSAHPLLGDEYLTTGSFISFPLVMHDNLMGVINLTNRAQRGLFVDEDVERVRLLGLVIALVAREAELPSRLLGTLAGHP